MANKQGFVFKIEIGRAGLVSVEIIHADGSRGNYVIEDLDADPERFNERLSKLAILRDAMNRAEPVHIEHVSGEAGEVIERVARISRDDLEPVVRVVPFTGLVVELSVHAENGISAGEERHDIAKVTLLTTDLSSVGLTLDLQAPERAVASQQLEMLREAQLSGRLVRLLVDAGSDTPSHDATTRAVGESNRIIAVAVDGSLDAFGEDRAREISGFVESISLINLGMGGGAQLFATVGFTTAPPFTGGGGTVGLTPFTPVTLQLLVPKNTPTYDLFEAGLRDNLRMRARVIMLREKRDKGKDEEEKREEEKLKERIDSGEVIGTPQPEGMERIIVKERLALAGMTVAHTTPLDNIGLAFTAELLAHLASASRPVWIDVTRETLDFGPEAPHCTPGVPTSDLTLKTLRDLRIPYPAVWNGVGCFNPGVYRFQFNLPTPFKVFVDGEELCLHDAEEEGVKMAHDCLHGEHTVRVEIEDWICDNEFIMDVYQLR
jgi:hypothetical protein